MTANPNIDSQMILGECIEEMSKLPDGCVDMVLVDLPYGTTVNKWDSVIPLDKLWEQYLRVTKPNGAMVFTAAQPFDKILGASNIADYRYEWIWHKNKATGHLNAKKMPLRAHENVLVFYRSQPTYNAQVTTGHAPMNTVRDKELLVGEVRNYNHANQMANDDRRTTRQPRSVLNIRAHDNIKADKFHPTQKPIELMAYMIKTYTNEGDLVLDNTMGSGTTCAAAKALGRRYIGIEIDQDYFEFAQNRVENTEVGSLDNVELVAPSFQSTRQEDRSHTKPKKSPEISQPKDLLEF